MDNAYVECCSHFSSAFDNWNEVFQLGLRRPAETMAAAVVRQDELYRLEKTFETEALAGAAHIVEMSRHGPRQISKQQLCYREKNIFYRVLPDAISGRAHVAALRGILLSDSTLVTVPLSMVIVYRGTPLLAQALVPLSAEPMKVFGAGIADENVEMLQEIDFIAAAVNVPLPDQVICETYQGLDGRLYVTNTNITTIALDDAMLLGGPLKRHEMLAVCPSVTASCEDTLSMLRSTAVLSSLTGVVTAPLGEQQKLLCDTLHFYGINLCLLKGVFDAYRHSHSGEGGVEWEQLKTVVSIEMIARTVKQEFYLEAQAKRLGMDDVGISKCFALHIKDAFEASDRKEHFMQVAMKKFAIANINREDEELLDAIYCTLRDYQDVIVERVSILTGARATTTREGDTERTTEKRVVTWLPFVVARVVPRLRDPKMGVTLARQYASVRTTQEHTLAFVLPLQIRVASWEGRAAQALELARVAAQMREERYGPFSLHTQYAKRIVCRHLFSSPTTANAREGCAMMALMLQRVGEKVGPLTFSQFHIEAGYWLLLVSSVVNVVVEAAQHFKAAGRLVPHSLRSSCGAWLYLQPSLGLLRCRQTHRGTFHMPVESLVSDAVYLSKVVIPDDFFVEYLWELGMELAVDEQHEVAGQVLTIAVGMRKRVHGSALDAAALLDDTLNVYRAWDPVKYGAYCDALERM